MSCNYVYAHDDPCEVQLDGYFTIGEGYTIRPTSCRCGGKFVWLRILSTGAEEMIGCVCCTPLRPDA